VVEVINRYAQQNRFGLVLDISTNPMVIFFAPEVDRTQQIIALVNR
jgi:hypothetical protein